MIYFEQEAEKEILLMGAIPPEYVMATVLWLGRALAFWLKIVRIIKTLLQKIRTPFGRRNQNFSFREERGSNETRRGLC
jgi:hypothetical protein